MAEHFPWFNWFPRDWITGTALMTPEQKGAFTDLLCYAWEQNPPCTLPDDDTQLARLSGLGSRWKKVGAAVRAKFTPIDGGLLRNAKQWSVYQDMVQHRERRRTAGAKGNAVRNASRNAPAEVIALHTPPQPQPQPKKDLAPPAKSPSKKPTWLAGYAEVWKEATGGEPNYGQFARVFKDAEKQHDPSIVLRAWKHYLKATEARFASAQSFAQRLGYWVNESKPAFMGYSA